MPPAGSTSDKRQNGVEPTKPVIRHKHRSGCGEKNRDPILKGDPMKALYLRPIKVLLFFLLVTIAGGSGLHPDAGADDPVPQQGPIDQLKKLIEPKASQKQLMAISKMPHYAISAAKFKVPVKITDLPPPWRNGELIVDCIAIFIGSSGPVGYSLGRGVQTQVLASGNYQGEVAVSLTDTHGVVNTNIVGLALALARNGEQCMVLGASCYNFDDCDNNEMTGYRLRCESIDFSKLIEDRLNTKPIN
jgi:hypothetical protein